MGIQTITKHAATGRRLEGEPKGLGGGREGTEGDREEAGRGWERRGG